MAARRGEAGQPEEGLKRLAEAAELAEETEDCWAAAEMRRLRGMLLLSTNEHDAAKDSLNQVLAVARQILRVASWDRPRAALPRSGQVAARDLLAPIYSWFTEGSACRSCKTPRRCSTFLSGGLDPLSKPILRILGLSDPYVAKFTGLHHLSGLRTIG